MGRLPSTCIMGVLHLKAHSTQAMSLSLVSDSEAMVPIVVLSLWLAFLSQAKSLILDHIYDVEALKEKDKMQKKMTILQKTN